MTARVPGQVLPLAALRWRMVRSSRARAGLVVALATLPVLAVLAVVVGATAPSGQETDLALLTPSILLAFLLLAIVAPLAAGGGTELYPPDQLVAYPIRTRTVFRTALLLAPLNLAWLLQVLAALGLITYVVDGSAAVVGGGLATMLAYLALVTVAGQGVAWTVIGLRQSRAGRLACWAAVAVLAATLLVLLALGDLIDAFDRAPTRWVFSTAMAPSEGSWSAWLARTAVLALGCWLAVRVSERACRWSLGRAADHGATSDARTHARRPLLGSDRQVLVALTRRGLWRSRAVRRGVLLLALLPGTLLAVAEVGWDSLLLLPGLVAAGTGVVFGINAFCLDGSGATWLATLPQRTSTTYWARTQVVLEVTAAVVVCAVLAGAVRAPAPTLAEAVCFAGAVVVAVARVGASCMHLSVKRPHHALLIGPRDAPAPPGTMALYSVRLAGSAALVGLTYGIAAQLDSVVTALVLTLGYLLLAVRSLLRTARAWDDPVVRARVVATVSAG